MSTTRPNSAATLERDPVCGMNIHPAAAKHVYELNGNNYYFCCASCAEKFKADPAKYLNQEPPAHSPGLVTLGAAAPKPPAAQRAPQTQVSPSAAYVCPMCPEVH